MPSKHSKTRRTLKKLKGGCGCQSQNKISGGGNNLPAPSFTNFDTYNKYIIPYNTSVGLPGGDPIDASNIVSTRMQPNMVGGKSKCKGKRQSKKNKKSMKKRFFTLVKNSKRRRYKGGNNYLNLINGNIQSSIFQTTGMSTTSNVINGVNNEHLNSQPQFIKNTPYI